MWKMIWDLNVPPKIRNFMWRAVSNIMPMQDNLYRRRVAVESTLSSTANTLKQKLTCCGSAPLPAMCGHWLEEVCRNATTMCENFSSYSS